MVSGGIIVGVAVAAAVFEENNIARTLIND
jgi:hypothetical protein